MTTEEIIEELKQLADPSKTGDFKRYAINTPKWIGIRTPELKAFAREVKKTVDDRHMAAAGLWKSGIFEARSVAFLIDDPKRVTPEQMDAWAADFDNWATVDGACSYLFCRTPFAYEKAVEWAEREPEFEKRAAFSLMAYLAVHDKKAPDEKFEPFLAIIEKHSEDDRNFVKKAVNWALRQIGKRSQKLNRLAIETAERIRERGTRPARWIAADALRELKSDAVKERLERKKVAEQILPNSTIGVFGSGQLGRMFAIEARKMGYRVHTFSPDADTPTGHISDVETTASYDDIDAIRKFAAAVDVVTFEFENVPSATIAAAAEFAPVHPRGEILHTTQNRLREKTFLSANGIPVVPYRHIKTLDDLHRAVNEIGSPAVLKTAGFGYDGKGQVRIDAVGEAEAAFASVGEQESVLEAFLDFDREVSVVCARNISGEFVHYGVIANDHANHILDVSVAPADVSADTMRDAVEIARTIAERFDYVGTMCVEFFLTAQGRLLVNEIAPRPHNSGHLTFGPCVTSQFEQQVRAVCGLPFGSTEFLRPAAMANLLGDLWANGEPDWASALAVPGVALHLYGKSEPRPGRKMGHLTATAETSKQAAEAVIMARSRL